MEKDTVDMIQALILEKEKMEFKKMKSAIASGIVQALGGK